MFVVIVNKIIGEFFIREFRNGSIAHGFIDVFKNFIFSPRIIAYPFFYQIIKFKIFVMSSDI